MTDQTREQTKGFIDGDMMETLFDISRQNMEYGERSLDIGALESSSDPKIVIFDLYPWVPTSIFQRFYVIRTKFVCVCVCARAIP